MDEKLTPEQLPEPQKGTVTRKEKGRYAKKKEPFLKKLLPWKGDGVRLAVIKIAILFFFTVFVVSGILLFRDLIYKPMQEDNSIKDLQSHMYDLDLTGTDLSGSDLTGTDTSQSTGRKPINFAKLQQINSDIIGWITIPNTRIDYPVLQSGTSDPEYYLYRNYMKEYTDYGSIFLDSNFKFDSSESRNYLLYGHHMDNGRMFSDVMKFSDLDFYNQNPVFWFDTAEGSSQWKIISIFKTNTLFSQGDIFYYNKTDFASDEAYLQYIYEVRIRSIIGTNVDFKASDDIITLSTCSYEFKGFRTVLVARRVRDGEDASVSAGYYNRALYPDCWYEKWGGEAPFWPESYQDAVSQGYISWLIQ